MLKEEPGPTLFHPVAGSPAGAVPLERDPQGKKVTTERKKPPAVCYLGFQTTEDGREYSLRVTAGVEPRLFALVITHAAFAAREVRFQDGPGLCFGKLQRELLADPDLLPSARLVLTADELLEYRQDQERRPLSRKRRGSAR